MRKLFRVSHLIVMLLIIGLVLGGCGTDKKESVEPNETKESQEPKEPYKIGLLVSLSGPIGFLGTDVRDTIQMEIAEINAAGGVDGHPLELVVEDDGFDPAKATSGLTKLVRQDNVLGIIGPLTGMLEPAIRPMSEREKIPTVNLYQTLPEMRARNDKYTFLVGPNEYIVVSGWLKILKDKGYTRVATIGANDTLSPVLFAELQKEAAAQGIEVKVLPDPVNLDSVDLTPYVAKLKDLATKNNSQVVMSMIWPPNVPGLLNTMKQMGVNLPVIQYFSGADNSLLNMGGPELNGLVMPGLKVVAGAALPDNDPQKKLIVDFKTRYETKFKMVAGMYGAYSYDAIHLMANALKESGADREKLRNALENTKNYVGVTGVFNYSADDHEGLSDDCLAIFQIKDKNFEYLGNVK